MMYDDLMLLQGQQILISGIDPPYWVMLTFIFSSVLVLLYIYYVTRTI